MTALEIPMTGAPSAGFESWDSISWETVQKQVRRLQVRIAKAIREGKRGKAKALQWILTHSFYAKLLAVKRVTQNRGSKTPGVDKVVLKTSKQKVQAVQSLQRRGYTPLPLRRIYIPKQNGKQRPLSIPTIGDRAMQALYLQALEPISEVLADRNAYGFRPKRNTADAIRQCFNIFARKDAARWVLEGDIRACFDSVNHQWLMNNIPMDKTILSKWLGVGYMEKGVFYDTEEGLPQGGIISPTIMNLTLSGLEQAVLSSTNQPDKAHVVIYADDFIVSGSSKEVLVDKVMPVIITFLKERGLSLSENKTRMTQIENGFDFLGFNVRKYNSKLLIKPAKKNIKSFLKQTRTLIKSSATIRTIDLIKWLNPKIRGWANYFSHVVAKKTFSRVDKDIHLALWRWARRRHPNKNAHWVQGKYFRTRTLRQWVFFANEESNNGKKKPLDLFHASSVPIKRHIKIKADANPYDPMFAEYFEERKRRTKYKLLSLKDVGRALPIF